MLLKALKKCKFREMACYCNVNTTLIHYCYTSICLFFMLKICLVCFAKGKFVYFSRKQFLYSYTVLYHLAIMCFEFFHICVANKNKNKKSQFFCVSGHTSHKQDLSSFLFKEFDDLENMDPALAEFERNRREYINTMKRIRLENPDITPQELEVKAQAEVMNKGPKSRAYYR